MRRAKLGALTTPQCEIVSDAKNPTGEVVTRATLLQVPAKGQEDFLNDLFPVVDGKAKRPDIPKEPGAVLVKEGDDFSFHVGRRGGSGGLGGCGQQPSRKTQRRV